MIRGHVRESSVRTHHRFIHGAIHRILIVISEVIHVISKKYATVIALTVSVAVAGCGGLAGSNQSAPTYGPEQATATGTQTQEETARRGNQTQEPAEPTFQAGQFTPGEYYTYSIERIGQSGTVNFSVVSATESTVTIEVTRKGLERVGGNSDYENQVRFTLSQSENATKINRTFISRLALGQSLVSSHSLEVGNSWTETSAGPSLELTVEREGEIQGVETAVVSTTLIEAPLGAGSTIQVAKSGDWPFALSYSTSRGATTITLSDYNRRSPRSGV